MHPTPKETFLITVVGVVGLIIPPHLHDFYALVEVGGQSRKTASIAHLSQSNIKWEARVGPLTADNDAYVSIRIQASRNSSNTEDMSVAEGGATVEELLANGIKSTTFALPAQGTFSIRNVGRLLLKVQQVAHVDGTSETHSRSSASLNNLATTLQTRFKLKGAMADLEKAVKCYRTALNLCPRGHPDRSMLLNNLASALQTRFEQKNEISDITESIKYYRVALYLRPQGHPYHSTSLNNLAGALWTRFNRQGDKADLEQTIEHYRSALVFRPRTHPYHARALNNLAGALQSRFSQCGDMADLQEAIEHYRVALELRPHGHPDHATSLNNLASALRARFSQQGDMADLEEAIVHYRVALDSCPRGHPDHSSTLRNLGTALRVRFNHRGDIPDLEQAIEHYRAALSLCPEGHPDHLASLNNLATALGTRFSQQGDVEDLEQATEYYLAVLELCPREHPDHSASLNNLAAALRTRFHQRGDTADLEKAILHYRAALNLCPREHPDYAASLSNLATALRTRSNQLDHAADLNEAITHYRVSLELRPRGHPYHSRTLNNLAGALHDCFIKRGDGADLEQAITHYRSALESCPPGHPNHSVTQNGLAAALRTRFEQLGEPADLGASFDALFSALNGSASGHPIFLDVHLELASNYLLQHNRAAIETSSLLDKAFRHYELAAMCRSAGSWRQLQASQIWVASAERYNHNSASDAYRTLLDSFDRYVTMAPTPSTRHELIKRVPSSLAADAASCAARWNNPSNAVEVLEQGRGIIWTQMGHLRTHLDHLREVSEHGGSLALEFRQLSLQLEQSSAGLRGDELTPSDKEARRYSQLAKEWDCLADRIRQVEGFSRFLMPPLYSDLKEAAREGPVIVVNASRHSCDAFIVTYIGSPLHVPLEHITLEEVSQLSSHFASVLKSPSSPGEERRRQNQLIHVLRQLWDLVVRPIVDRLTDIRSQAQSGSRIWWCPTSVFTSLPLHAAGSYRSGMVNLSDLFVSSYTPTLSALIRSRRDQTGALVAPQIAVIGQAKPDWKSGESRLHSVDAELSLVGSLVPAAMPSIELANTLATDTAVLHALREHSWVHLACHGKQDHAQPFNSSFVMHERPLSLLDIIRADVEHADFAFLSTCHTAVCDKATPDEVIHLAAGMQFAGFKSVIGTMWAVDDGIVHHMVAAFYRNLFADGMDSAKAAEALCKAAKMVDKKQVPLDQRIVFIHIGI